MGYAEGLVENYLVREAEKRGYLCYKFTSPGRKGVPDRILIARGTVIFIECKSSTGRLSEIQKYVIDKMEQQGATVAVVSTRQEVDALLEKLPI